MYIFMKSDAPHNREEVIEWLKQSLCENNQIIGVQIFYHKKTEWILTHFFVKSFIFHGVYYSPQYNQYAFHAIIIRDFKKEINDYAFNPLVCFPNVGKFDSWDKMIDGTATYFCNMWKL
jgi:hypothetical protein